MAFETKSLDAIADKFNNNGMNVPSMHWQYGTLWIETEDKNDLEIVKQAMTEDVLAGGFTVQFSEMKPTQREPWTEWAMDVVPVQEVNNVLA
jgi:hypothetical protein